MTNPLELLAQRIEGDPFFLACTLRLYAHSEKLTDEELADELGCAQEVLVEMRLCRTPTLEAPAFNREVTAIAERFGVKKNALVKAVRRAQVLLQAQGASSTLLAARDRRPEPEP